MLRTLSIVPLLLALAGSAQAQTSFTTGASDTPTEYGQRGLVLGVGELRIDLAPRDFGLLFGGIGGGSFNQDVGGLRIGRRDDQSRGGSRARLPAEQTILRLSLGAAYGVTPELEVGTMLVPIYIAPQGDFGDIEVYGRYRFLAEGPVQIGGQVTVAIPTDTEFALGFGAPIQLRFGQVRIDTGAELELLFGGDTNVDLDLPVAIAVDIADGFFGGVRSGIFLPDFDDAAIPLIGHIGYTLMSGKGPFMDLVASFGWPRFFWTGAGDNIDIDTFDVILGARIFFTVR